MNVTNILIIGAVVLVGIFFVLPMLGSSKSDNSNGSGSLGGGDMPTGNQGAGDKTGDVTNIYYIPGTGSNDSVAPSEPSSQTFSYNPLAAVSKNYTPGQGTFLPNTAAGTFNPQVHSNNPYVVNGYVQTNPVNTAAGTFNPQVHSNNPSVVNGYVPGNGSGKSTTQNLTSSFQGQKGVTYVAEKQRDNTTIYRATNVSKRGK